MGLIFKIGSYLTSNRNTIYPHVNIVFDGNSLVRSDQATSIEQWVPNYIKSKLRPFCKKLTFNSLGVGGQQMQTMVDNYSTNIAPLYINSPNVINVLVFTEDVNGIGNGGGSDTGAGNLAKQNSYLTSANSTGWDIIITWNAWYKRAPYSGGDSEAARTRRKDFFDLVDSGGLVGNTVNIDMRTLPNVGGPSGQNQDSYFEDHIHLTTIGNEEVSEKILEIIKIELDKK